MLYLYLIEPKKFVIPVSREAFIGREGFDVVIRTETGSHFVGSDVTVSRNHAKIYYRQGRYYIQDLGSSNGTRINGKFISGWEPKKQSSEVELVEGTVIEIGMQIMFRVEFEKEIEEVSMRKDNCVVLLLLRDYLLETLNKILEVQQGKSGSLNELQSSLKYVINKERFREIVEKDIDKNAIDAIRRHINIMEQDPYIYQESFELLDGLKNIIKGIINNTKREYELCKQSQ